MFARRLLFPALTAVLMFVMVAGPVAAGRQWCRKDPAFQVAGVQVNVDVAVSWDDVKSVNGPLEVTLYVPTGTEASVIFADDGFNGHGEITAIYESDQLKAGPQGVQILVAVTIPRAHKNVLANVTVTPAHGRVASINNGSTRTIEVRTKVETAA